MPRKEWDKELARKMYDSGALDREIAAKVGVTVSTISRWRKANSLPARVFPRGRIDTDKIRQFYEQGLSDGEIASQMDISISSVRNWRRDNDKTANKKWDIKKALLLYNEGYGDEEIARQVGTDAKRIWEWRQGEGLPPVARSASATKEEDELEDDAPLESELEDVPLGAELEDVPLDDGIGRHVLEDEFDEDYDESEEEEDLEDDDTGVSYAEGRPTVLEAALEVFWTQGYMIGELASDLGLDTDFVTSWVQLNHPEDLDRSDFDTAEALELLNAGRQDRDIAAEMRVPVRAVTSWRRRHDYAAHTPAAFDEEKAEQLFRRGMYDRDIARELGGDVTKADVQAWRVRNNLSLYGDTKSRQDSRPRSERVSPQPRRTPSTGRPGYEERSSYSNNRPVSGNRSANQRYQNNYSNSYSGGYSGNTYQRDTAPRRVQPRRQQDGYNSFETGQRRSRTRSWDENEARKLWESGMSDVDIAREVGTTPGAIRAWRQQTGLRHPR